MEAGALCGTDDSNFLGIVGFLFQQFKVLRVFFTMSYNLIDVEFSLFSIGFYVKVGRKFHEGREVFFWLATSP